MLATLWGRIFLCHTVCSKILNPYLVFDVSQVIVVKINIYKRITSIFLNMHSKQVVSFY
jgi:hypothetical protein